MKVAAMFFAESAQHTNDRLQVAGGLWDGLTASRLPAAHPIPVVVLLRLDPSDVGQSYHLDFQVTGPERQAAGHTHVDVAVNTFRQQTAVVVEVPGSFAVAGGYKVQLRSQVGTDEVVFQVVEQGQSPVEQAVEGYALGLDKR